MGTQKHFGVMELFELATPFSNHTFVIIMVKVEIDEGSGFCFGVVTAIHKAEEELAKGALFIAWETLCTTAVKWNA